LSWKKLTLEERKKVKGQGRGRHQRLPPCAFQLTPSRIECDASRFVKTSKKEKGKRQKESGEPHLLRSGFQPHFCLLPFSFLLPDGRFQRIEALL
jgi:hypothetical protein